MAKDNQIHVCPPGCSHCLYENTCAACLPGYYIDLNKRCIRCSPQCDVCVAGFP